MTMSNHRKPKTTRRKPGRSTSRTSTRRTPRTLKIERSEASDDSAPTTLATGSIQDDKGKERETRDDISTVMPPRLKKKKRKDTTPQPADFATELAAARAKWKEREQAWQRAHKTTARIPAALRSERDAELPPPGGQMALAAPPLDNPMQEGTQLAAAGRQPRGGSDRSNTARNVHR
jgi:hypothetical protein